MAVGRASIKKWKSGTISRAAESRKKDFAADEICRIMEMCVKNGVVDFSSNGLVLKFSPRPETRIEIEKPLARFSVPEPSAEEMAKIAKDQQDVDELNLKEDQLGMLLIEDPVEFERQLLAGELTDDEPDTSDDERERQEA